MLKRRLFAAMTAACMTTFTMPVYAETVSVPESAATAVRAEAEPVQGTVVTAASTATTTATVPQTTEPAARKTDFRGILGHYSGGYSFFEGGKPDYGKLELALHLEDQWGSFGHMIGSFSIGSGKHANCYTIDASEVDPDTPGTYYLYVDTVAGAESDFDSFEEIPQIGLTHGPIHVTMEAHRTSFMITVLKKHTELRIACGTGNENNEYVRPVTDSGIADFFTVYNLWEDNDSAAYTFSDPSVAEIVDKNMDVNGCNQILRVNCLKEGETTLTVTAADGRTASCLIRVLSRGNYYTEPAFTTTTAVETAVYTEATPKTTVTDEQGRFRDADGNIIIEHNGTTMILNPGTANDDLTADWGNADCNDGVDVADVVLVARYAVADAEADISEQGKRNADVTHDGNVNEKDASRILMYIAKKISLEELAK